MNKLIILIVALLLISCSESDFEKPYEDPETGECLDSLSISSRYQEIDWNNTKVLQYDSINGVIRLNATDQTKKLKAGSIFVADMDTTALVLVVVNSEIANNEIELKTIQGSISDIFANTQIILSTDYNTATRSQNTYFPKSVRYWDEKGEKHEVRMTRSSTDEPTHLTGKLWEWTSKDLGDSHTFINEKCLTVNYTGLKMSVDIDLDLMLNFGARTKWQLISNGIKQWQSELLKAKSSIKGQVYLGAGVNAKVSGTITSESATDVKLKENLFSPIMVKFMVGSVPVYVKLRVQLWGKTPTYECTGSLEASATIGITGNGEFGLEYDQQTNRITTIKGAEYNYKEPVFNQKGEGSVKYEVCLYPKVKVSLYNLVSANITLEPYVGVELEGITQKMGNDNLLAWSGRIYGGMATKPSLSFDFIGEKGWTAELPRFKLFENVLFKTPSKIKVDTDDFMSYMNLKNGRAGTVCFDVFDSYVGNKYIKTIFPQIVKFEAMGKLSSQFGITRDGRASVEWTPASTDDKLKGSIYNGRGELLCEATINADGKAEQSWGKYIIDSDPIIESVSIMDNGKYEGGKAFPDMIVTCHAPTVENCIGDIYDWRLEAFNAEGTYNRGYEVYPDNGGDRITPLGNNRYEWNPEIFLFRNGKWPYNSFTDYDYENWRAKAIIYLRSVYYTKDNLEVKSSWNPILYTYNIKPSVKVLKVERVKDDLINVKIQATGSFWFDEICVEEMSELSLDVGKRSVSKDGLYEIYCDLKYNGQKESILKLYVLDSDDKKVLIPIDKYIKVKWIKGIGNDYYVEPELIELKK